ncbi:DNA replication protein DnaC [Anseongella ginsenosidimutans]|uniref:DNA replication protein DnaC n=1 Tax=Anseongella ginsenosidimutans TaxID=496056 RepID=A0A4R3KJ16_9SPHI|nr:IS21-like element helper ATPase IstB [Anseongella ginsenosidimutans]QEC52150.1 ATP-binding protein [Anseongella ginsenosidimutans]QEC52463.1 ATP-binding protein [Anseongella ginsenosidimutans]QEC53037.1 ATP-binding protein [Anseongella ginsenosidimutans]QEC53633.1 ATP-binding protein [Anseongella ginsenosidimutans]TCS83617.1 DNA replication protein DnaC [Anseongella ginsenosidimutans]
MTEKKEQIKHLCKQFKMSGIAHSLDTLIAQGESQEMGLTEFTWNLLETEASHRQQREMERRLKTARLPASSSLEAYDATVENGLPKNRLNQLRELNWLDQIYNIILLGPSGVGKTHLAAGLCRDAIQGGYNAFFRTMEDIMNMLKMKDMTRSAMADYKRLTKAQLIVIDDMMLFPVEKAQAVALFNFINHLYESTSFIITTNKMPAEWAGLLGDEVLATALLDRLLYRCEAITLTGKSYRLKHRKSIFEHSTA